MLAFRRHLYRLIADTNKEYWRGPSLDSRRISPPAATDGSVNPSDTPD